MLSALNLRLAILFAVALIAACGPSRSREASCTGPSPMDCVVIGSGEGDPDPGSAVTTISGPETVTYDGRLGTRCRKFGYESLGKAGQPLLVRSCVIPLWRVIASPEMFHERVIESSGVLAVSTFGPDGAISNVVVYPDERSFEVGEPTAGIAVFGFDRTDMSTAKGKVTVFRSVDVAGIYDARYLSLNPFNGSGGAIKLLRQPRVLLPRSSTSPGAVVYSSFTEAPSSDVSLGHPSGEVVP